jgi:hypothetical protein
MSSWVLTKGLTNLLHQINVWAPDRDHTSDGTIGDTRHKAEVSGHNPDDTKGSKAEWNGDPDSTPEVRALDVDVDFRNGATAQQMVDHIVGLKPSSVLRYVIYNRRIYEADNAWKSRAYTGESAHTEHIHFSGAYSQAADNNTTFDYRLGDIPVALTAADKTWITSEIAKAIAAVQALTATKPLNGPDGKPDGTSYSPIGSLAQGQGIPNGTREGAPRDAAWRVIQDLGELLVGVNGKVDALAVQVEQLQ